MKLPFRLTLTLWYSTFLLAAIILFSSAVYVLMARALVGNLHTALETRANQMAQRAEQSRHPSGFNDGDEQDGTFIPSALLSATGTVRIGAPPAGIRRWLAQRPSPLQPGFHVYHLSNLEFATRAVDRNGQVHGYVLVWESLRAVDESRRSLLLILLALGPALVIVAGLGGWALAGRSLRPIAHVTEAAASISVSDLTRRVPVASTHDELGKLAATFNAMIERLESAVRRERRFTSDASHELRAPLAVIRAETTLALERSRPAAEYQRALAVIDEQAAAMEELIAELLLLARGEAVLLDRHETVPLAAIVDEAVDQCRLRLDERGVRALVDVPDNVRVDAAPQLLARALRNLVDNAAKVSPPGDNILICGRQENGHALVTVEDHGPGIAPEHQPHIFEPFYQVAAAHTPGESHGLGLAICRFIVAAHGGTVTLQSIPGQGTNFRIELPASEPEPISARVAAREQEAVTH